MRVLFLLLFLSVSLACWSEPVRYSQELKQLHGNVLTYILKNTAVETQVASLLADLKDNGSWDDVIYDDKVDGPWRTKKHLDRLLEIAKAYRTKGNAIYAGKAVSGKIHLALNYWLENNFKSPYAWWYNEIGTPEVLGQILILMEDELSRKQIDLGVVILNRSKIQYTGQNRVWVAGNLLMKSLLLKNIDSIKVAAKTIQSELVVRKSEGIQPDWSFHQHGAQLQFGNYGLSYVGDMMKWIQMLRNTPFSFDESKMAILKNYLLEGLQWATWKGKFDIPSCGRKLEENSPTKKASSLLSIYRSIADLDPANAKEYGNASDYNNLEGHKHFWRSEYQVKRNPDYMFSVKMVSKRVKGGESSRYENVNGYHMGDGATYLMQKGDEYENIFPYWDWRKIPGTTIKQDDRKLPILLAVGYFTENEFVGGVSDGKNGIAVMDFNRDGLSAKKSWFMFNDMIVCLGSGISLSENVPVTTSVNQVFHRENPVIKTSKGEPRTCGAEKEEITDPAWILHDKIGYIFPEKSNIHLETKMVEGSWYRYATYSADEKISARIFNLWIDHGANPVNESYSYILVPNASKAKMEKLEKKNPFTIQNTTALQEVVANDGNLAGFIFYKPGASKAFGGITANQPCVAMLKKEKEGIYISVADPTQKMGEIQLTIAGNYQSFNSNIKNGKTIVNILLPQGGEAGKSKTVFLEKL